VSGFAGGRAQGRPAARDTSGFDDDEAQRGSGSVNRGRGADVDENTEGDSAGKAARGMRSKLAKPIKLSL
jgi:hypothetical protein